MSKKTILVIDDEKDLLKLLQYNLQNEGYEVLLAESGEKGYEQAKIKQPDLILLDLMLPYMSGLEICRLLKLEKETKNIPIFMLTAKSSETDHVVGLELGAADYLAKPFSVKILLARIRNIFKASTPPKDAMKKIEAGDIALDRERFHCAVKGKTIQLTKTEFEILSHLMQSPEIVITRERLTENVWGKGSVVSDTSINMHIKGLRQKLGKFRDKIQTVHGVGYRFPSS